MKKIIAGMLALSLAMAAVGCGSIEEEEPTTPLTNNSDAETEENSPETETQIGYVNANNTVIIDLTKTYMGSDSSFNEEQDAQDVYSMLERAIGQYNSVIARDEKGYFDSINFMSILDSKTFQMLTEDPERDFDLPDAEEDCCGSAVRLMYSAFPDELAKIQEEYESNSTEFVKQTAAFMKEKSGTISADDFKTTDGYESDSIYVSLFDENSWVRETAPEGFADAPEKFCISPDENIVFTIQVEEFIKNERGTFAVLDLCIAQDDVKYCFNDTYAWVTDGKAGVIIEQASFDENDLKGKSLEEAKDEAITIHNVKNANAVAKTAYNAAAEYLADCKTTGRPLEQVMKDGDFGISSEGLDLSADAPTSKGDAHMYRVVNECEYHNGTLLLKVYDANELFIQYKDENGVIGQYPDPIDPADAGKAEWGVRLVPDISAEETAE